MSSSLSEWLAYIEAVHPQDVELGLDRVRTVADTMGLLPPASKTVIVAGTNGKGSTAVFTESILRAGGLTVGTTLSPHVNVFNERIRLDGNLSCDDQICESFTRVENARSGVPLTYFEFSSLAALDCFRASGVDVAILEVGLGGRLDAFNIVDADVAAITSIGLDHQDFLGDELEGIGAEKAGVLRKRQQIVLGDKVTASVLERARELECSVSQLGVDSELTMTASNWSLETSRGQFPALPWGSLAPQNCALGIEIAGNFVEVTRELIHAALKQATLPGRFEAIFCHDRQWLIDVAHNPAGAAFLGELLSMRYPGRRIVAVLGMLDGKDHTGVVEALASQVSRWICMPTFGPRKLDAADLVSKIPTHLDAMKVESAAAACELASSLSTEEDVILAFGSFSTACSVRELLTRRPIHRFNELS